MRLRPRDSTPYSSSRSSSPPDDSGSRLIFQQAAVTDSCYYTDASSARQELSESKFLPLPRTLWMTASIYPAAFIFLRWEKFLEPFLYLLLIHNACSPCDRRIGRLPPSCLSLRSASQQANAEVPSYILNDGCHLLQPSSSTQLSKVKTFGTPRSFDAVANHWITSPDF